MKNLYVVKLKIGNRIYSTPEFFSEDQLPKIGNKFTTTRPLSNGIDKQKISGNIIAINLHTKCAI